MGTVFGFVSSDVKSKLDILVELLESDETGTCYVSIKTMMLYEKDEGLFEKKDYVSGSRTLLRLHRGLDFIRVFLRSLGELQHSDRTSYVCQQAYDQTLAQYHPWLIKKGARMAMYTMPNREQLLKRVNNSDRSFHVSISSKNAFSSAHGKCCFTFGCTIEY